MDLLIGCGSRRDKIVGDGDFVDLVTLDNNPDHRPDIVHDLERLPLPFPDESFNEIHAYEVLEHVGAQGDYKFFFAQFSDFWRLLKPGGLLCGTSPSYSSRWKWGDPSHRRVIMPESFIFLDQEQYAKQVGKNSMSDFRYLYKADFEQTPLMWEDPEVFCFALRAVKPSRYSV